MLAVNKKGADQAAQMRRLYAPILFAYGIRHIFSWPVSYMFILSHLTIYDS